jgi:hypothetical protein
MTAEKIGQEILAAAQRFIGASEVQDNRKWTKENEAIIRGLKTVGWEPGWPYCMAAVSAVWLGTYRKLGAPEAFIEKLDAVLGVSVMSSWDALEKSGFTRIDRWKWKPEAVTPGAIFFMRMGSKYQGHAGLVRGWRDGSDKGTIETLEANTSPPKKTISAAADREGDGIYSKVRPVDFAQTPGLHLLGFWNPPV